MRDAVIQLARGAEVFAGDLVQQFLAIGGRISRLERRQFVQRHAERIDVGAIVDDAHRKRLLGAHVAQRPQHPLYLLTV